MESDIYATPESDVELQQEQSLPIHLYSPTQVACGTIGGPVGLVFFLASNFDAMGQLRRKKKTLLIGFALIVALVTALPFLPESVPSAPFTLAYIIVGRQIAERYQMTKQAIASSEVYEFHSNWRVFGYGILCLIGSMVVILGPLMLLISAGLWEPA